MISLFFYTITIYISLYKRGLRGGNPLTRCVLGQKEEPQMGGSSFCITKCVSCQVHCK